MDSLFKIYVLNFKTFFFETRTDIKFICKSLPNLQKNLVWGYFVDLTLLTMYF